MLCGQTPRLPRQISQRHHARGVFEFDHIVGASANRRRLLDQALCERFAHLPVNADFNEVVEYESLIARNRATIQVRPSSAGWSRPPRDFLIHGFRARSVYSTIRALLAWERAASKNSGRHVDRYLH